MLIKDHLAQSGEVLFRWRSFVLTIFVPIVIYATWQGEVIETWFGEMAGDIYETACLLMVFTGIALRAYTVGYVPARTSGRNTKGQVADSLNTTGLYSAVRNPLYLANAIGYLGITLYPQWIWIGLAMAVVLVLYFERIIAAEERFLVGKFGAEYTDWAARTPAFFPSFRNWQSPAMPFSWRTVVRREHPTWLGTIVMLYILEMLSTRVEGEAMSGETGWHILLAVAIIGQIVIMLMKKHTGFFRVEGR